MKKIFLTIFIFFICIPVYALEFPSVTCKNILFIDLDNNEVIYEKNSNEKVMIASITKVMTALVSIENIDDFDEKVVVTNDMISNIGYDYVKVGFKAGDVVTYNDLLYGTLLRSGADATNILGISISGSIENFVKLMNEKAKELNMNNTNFSNTIGMDSENNYSTAKDVAKLFNYAFNNKKFNEIIKSENYITSSSDYNISGILKLLHNDEYNMKYVLGGKTGYTGGAGECFVSISNYNNHNYLLVILGSDDNSKFEHFKDSKKIYEYFFDNYDYKKILSKDDIITKIKTIYDEEIIIKSNDNVISYMDKNIKKSDLKYEYKGNKILNKDVKKNDKIGTFYISYNGENLYEKDVYATSNVDITMSYFLKNNVILVILVIVILFLFSLYLNKKRKNRKNNTR